MAAAFDTTIVEDILFHDNLEYIRKDQRILTENQCFLHHNLDIGTHSCRRIEVKTNYTKQSWQRTLAQQAKASHLVAYSQVAEMDRGWIYFCNKACRKLTYIRKIAVIYPFKIKCNERKFFESHLNTEHFEI